MFGSENAFSGQYTCYTLNTQKKPNITVKIAVVEGDFASLVGLGFPLSVSIFKKRIWDLVKQIGLLSPPGVDSPLARLFWPAPDYKSQAKEKESKDLRPPVPATCIVAI